MHTDTNKIKYSVTLPCVNENGCYEMRLESIGGLGADTLGKKYPEMSENNLAGIDLGFKNVQSRLFSSDGKYEKVPYTELKSKWGYKNSRYGLA